MWRCSMVFVSVLVFVFSVCRDIRVFVVEVKFIGRLFIVGMRIVFRGLGGRGVFGVLRLIRRFRMDREDVGVSRGVG